MLGAFHYRLDFVIIPVPLPAVSVHFWMVVEIAPGALQDYLASWNWAFVQVQQARMQGGGSMGFGQTPLFLATQLSIGNNLNV